MSSNAVALGNNTAQSNGTRSTCVTSKFAAPARATFTVTGSVSADAANARILSGIVAENMTVWRWPLKYDMISRRSSSNPVSTCSHRRPTLAMASEDEQ